MASCEDPTDRTEAQGNNKSVEPERLATVEEHTANPQIFK